MKRHLFTVSILIYAATFCSFSQVYFKENLSRYTAGNNLENVSQANGWTTNLGDWTVSGKNDGANSSSLSPVIATETMSYLNFATSNKVIVCDPTVMGTTTSYRQTILRFSKDAISLTEPNNLVYYSSMLNLSGSADGDTGPLMGLIKQGTFDVDPGYALPSSSYSTTWRARVWAKVTGTQVQFGISKSGTPTVWSTTSYNLSDTHLLLVKYVNKSVSSSNAADEFYLLIDPVVTELEPAASAYMAAEGNSSGGGADLRMAAIVSQKLKMKIGQIRLTGTYNEAITPDGTYQATGLSSLEQNHAFKVIPGENSVNLYAIQSGSLSISDLSGKSIFSKKLVCDESLSVPIQKGVYLIKYRNTDGESLVNKICVH